MTILLIGRNGQVGWELERLLGGRSRLLPAGEGRPPLAAVDYPDIDLASPDSIRAALRRHGPSLVINAAGYTAVDGAESEPDLAMAVNGAAPGVIAEELRRTGGAMVHYSTDYVFDGTKASPYREEDFPNPLSVYGRSKLAGEEAVRAAGIPHLIIRGSWIYGSRGSNFLLTILRLARERVELRIVNDQIGAPTWCRFIAEATVEMIRKGVHRAPPGDGSAVAMDPSGTYNLAAEGHTTWFGFAEAILRLDARREEQIVEHVLPVSTGDYPTAARRPLNSRLDCTRVREDFGIEPPPWEGSLRRVMAELG